MKQTVIFLSSFLLLSALNSSYAQKHSFEFQDREFMLDGKPFQIISGEMHPARIPKEYWRHRIQMAKAMGCNTIAAYVFWNYHEPKEGVFDFTTSNHDIKRFIKIAQEEGMWVILRPGPYVCAEWDFGGIPSYLLKIPDIRVRCMDERYMNAVRRYVGALVKEVRQLQITEGGPVLMLQIENEYGSFGNDRNYLEELRKCWMSNDISIPFYTADGPTPYMLEAGSLAGCASGLDSGYDMASFETAYSINKGVPVFSSETYPGWLTHWGEQWQRPDTTDLYKEVRFLMENKKSFNFYVIHGGTNFGFTAGANAGGKGYEPDITSYDYDAPISEQGRPTHKYFALRSIINSYLPSGEKMPDLPEPIPAIDIPEIAMRPLTSIWQHLPAAITAVQPPTFEALGQNQGIVVYKTLLFGHKSGKLKVTDLHDYATAFLNGKFIGVLDRREGVMEIDLPKSDETNPVLELVVEGMGHINFGQEIIDRKGITDRVTLNGMTLMNWEVFRLPMDDTFMLSLVSSGNTSDTGKPGIYYEGKFRLDHTADTYFDLKNYQKGVAWINGHNLGRFWNIGPQQRLYCPASWLNEGENQLIVLDLLQTVPKSIAGFMSSE